MTIRPAPSMVDFIRSWYLPRHWRAMRCPPGCGLPTRDSKRRFQEACPGDSAPGLPWKPIPSLTLRACMRGIPRWRVTPAVATRFQSARRETARPARRAPPLRCCRGAAPQRSVIDIISRHLYDVHMFNLKPSRALHEAEQRYDIRRGRRGAPLRIRFSSANRRHSPHCLHEKGERWGHQRSGGVSRSRRPCSDQTHRL